jgi:hypothetical protein
MVRTVPKVSELVERDTIGCLSFVTLRQSFVYGMCSARTVQRLWTLGLCLGWPQTIAEVINGASWIA